MKRLFSVSVLFGIILTSLAMADPGDTLWTRTYGGDQPDECNSVQQTTDGGYIVAGFTGGGYGGNSDVYLFKTDSSGDTLWTRTYGGSNSEVANSVQQTSDGGYIVAGTTNSFGAGNRDVYLVKTDSAGDTLWTRTYGGNDDDFGCSVQQTSDGGYIIAGTTGTVGGGLYDVYLVKTDPSGDTLWTRTYGGSEGDFGYSVQQTLDGGYIIAGETLVSPPLNTDFYLVKTNSSGDTLWTRTYGGGDSQVANSVQQTSDGGYIIAGTTGTVGGGWYDVYLVKTDPSGDTLWTRTYGGNDDDFGCSVQQTSDSGYVIAGTTKSFGAGFRDVYLVRTDSSGDTIWTRTYGGGDNDEGSSVQQTSNGGYIIAGWTHSFGGYYKDGYLVRVAGEELPAVSIEMIPDDPPVTVPAGGSFTFTGILTNNTDQPQATDVGVFVNVPGYGLYGPLLYYSGIPLSPYQSISIPGITQNVPGFAPFGTYDYIAYCGDYPTTPIDSTSFEFTVVAPIAGRANEWNLSGWFDDKIEVIPSQFILMGNYPNPFNAETTINYQLPADSDVSLEVFNLMGQKVEVLISDRIEAGYHSVQWDASSFSSGIYFYRITARDKIFTKRMTLLK